MGMDIYKEYLDMIVPLFQLADSVPEKYREFASDIVNSTIVSATTGALKGWPIEKCQIAFAVNGLSFDDMEYVLDGEYCLHENAEKCSESWYSLVEKTKTENQPSSVMNDILINLEVTLYPGMNQYLNEDLVDTIISLTSRYEKTMSKYNFSMT